MPVSDRTKELAKIFGLNKPYAYNLSAFTYNFTTDYHRLEQAFPGASVAWDINNCTKEWPNYYLRIYNISNNKYDWPEQYQLRAFLLNSNGVSVFINTQKGSIRRDYRGITATYHPVDERWMVIR
jgi:hypothetical protein